RLVERRVVKDVVALLFDPLRAEALLREIADHGDEPVARSELVSELLEPAARALSHERVDGPLALQQLVYQVPADEAGRAGHEVVHPALISSPQLEFGSL